MMRMDVPSYLVELLFARHYFAIPVPGLPPASGLEEVSPAGVARPELAGLWQEMWWAGLRWRHADGSAEKLFWGLAVPQAPVPRDVCRQWTNATRHRLAGEGLSAPPRGLPAGVSDVLVLPLAGAWECRVDAQRLAVSAQTWMGYDDGAGSA